MGRCRYEHKTESEREGKKKKQGGCYFFQLVIPEGTVATEQRSNMQIVAL